MDFKLNVSERLTLLGILPREGNFINTRIIREVILKIDFSDKETKEFEIKKVGESISFRKKEGSIGKLIEIKERAFALICESLEKLDKENKLTQEHFTIYEKFIESKNTTDNTTDKKD